MIIECHTCKFSEKVDALRIPPAGRKVKCPKCGHIFFVKRPEVSAENSVPSPEIESITGPHGAAVRRKGSRLWTVLPEDGIPDRGVSVGLQLLLAKEDKERAGDPAITKGVVRMGLPSLTAMIPTWLPSVAVMVTALATILGYFFGFGLNTFFKETVFFSFTDLAWATVAIVAVIVCLTLFEAAMAGRHIKTSSFFWGIRAGFICVEPVVWRLGLPLMTAFYSIALPMALIGASFGWFLVAPPVFLGIMTGGFLYLITSLYPLEPGPGSRCLEELTGSPDIPKQLKWSIITRFMAVRLSNDASSGRAMSAAAIFLSGWVALAGAALYFLTSPMFTRGSFAGVIWQTLFSIFGLCYTMWLIVRIIQMVRTAARLRGNTKLLTVTPSPEMVDSWMKSSAIVRHMPKLQNASWKWASAPAGTFMIQRGADDRRFYWFASGQAAVFARDKNDAPLHVATLGPGSGVGEIALLENVKRTADVVIEQTAIVAMLDYDDFIKCTNDEERRQFREVVMAGQALSRSHVFFGLPGPDREHWIACGTPYRYESGEIIVNEGSEENWIGLIASGRVEVLKNDAFITQIGPDTVIGEMAYLSNKKRNATLKAMESTILWRWEAKWLDSELGQSNLRGVLSKLAKEREKP